MGDTTPDLHSVKMAFRCNTHLKLLDTPFLRVNANGKQYAVLRGVFRQESLSGKPITQKHSLCVYGKSCERVQNLQAGDYVAIYGHIFRHADSLTFETHHMGAQPVEAQDVREDDLIPDADFQGEFNRYQKRRKHELARLNKKGPTNRGRGRGELD